MRTILALLSLICISLAVSKEDMDSSLRTPHP